MFEGDAMGWSSVDRRVHMFWYWGDGVGSTCMFVHAD